MDRHNIFSAGTVQKSPVIGAVDHLYNNSIGRCTETRYICSAQISPPRTQNPGRLTTHRTICCSLAAQDGPQSTVSLEAECMPAAAKLPELLAGGFIRVRIMVEGYTLPRPRMSERVMSGKVAILPSEVEPLPSVCGTPFHALCFVISK